MSSTASDPAGARTIVLIHGMWMTRLSWEHWSSQDSDRGHHVLAPAWAGLEAEPEQLRRDPWRLRTSASPTSSTTTGRTSACKPLCGSKASPREPDTHRLDLPA
jgi:hypothetical protein